MASKTVREYLSSYQLTHDIAETTLQQYGYGVTALCRWARREVALNELTDDLLNHWIEHRRQANIRGERGHSRITIRGQAASIKTLWLAAFDEGLASTRPMRVKRLKIDAPMIETWNETEFGQIVAACEMLDGSFGFGVLRRHVMRAMLLSGYYSGLRPCDLLSLPKEIVGDDGNFEVRQQKTGEIIPCHFPPDTMKAIASMGSFPDPRIFPLTRKTLRYWFIKLCALAGVKGTPKWMRRTGATQVEIAQPGAAQAFLGHKTPGLAWRHYIDRKQIQARKPLPPPLAG